VEYIILGSMLNVFGGLFFMVFVIGVALYWFVNKRTQKDESVSQLTPSTYNGWFDNLQKEIHQKNLKSKAATYDRIMSHLKNVKDNEKRSREVRRANIALKNIVKWFKEEKERLHL